MTAAMSAVAVLAHVLVAVGAVGAVVRRAARCPVQAAEQERDGVRRALAATDRTGATAPR